MLSFTYLLTTMLIGLKLCGLIDWSWVAVFTPIVSLITIRVIVISVLFKWLWVKDKYL